MSPTAAPAAPGPPAPPAEEVALPAMRFAWVAVGRLQATASYRREVRPYWVKHLAKQWDEAKLDPLTIAERPDGRLVIIAGNHRYLARIDLGDMEYLLPCIIHRGLTEEQEALRFYATDKLRLQQSAADQFRALLTIHDPMAVQIDTIVRTLGLAIDLAPKGTTFRKHTIRAVAALYRAYRIGGPVFFERSLRLIRDTWTDGVWPAGEGPRTIFTHQIIVSLVGFLVRYDHPDAQPRLDYAVLEKRLRLTGPYGYEVTVKKHRQEDARSRHNDGAQGGMYALWDVYNYRRREADKLDKALIEKRVKGHQEEPPDIAAANRTPSEAGRRASGGRWTNPTPVPQAAQGVPPAGGSL